MMACKHPPYVQPAPKVVAEDNFPPQIKNIIVNRCATPGCHNAASYQISGGGLLLDSWEHLFGGGSHGAVIIPYSPENSSMLYFTNAHEDLGPVPTDESMKMPLNSEPLSRAEYITLRDWVKQGAPDKNGVIPFASGADTRQKIYLAHQGCDYVTVIDAEKHVVMRTIPVGREFPIESAHSLKVSPNGHDVFLCFWASQYIQKIDARTDTITGQVNLGNANSNMLFFTPDGQDLLLTNWFSNTLLRINTASGQVVSNYNGAFAAPHGIATNSNADTLYVTEQYGNMLHKIPANGGTIIKVSVTADAPQATGTNMPGLHNIMMTPAYDKYFVTCEETNEVRVMNRYTDQLIQVIPVGKRPQEMAISKTQPYLFVACLEDSTNNSIYKGSVYIINYNTNEIVQRISDRYYLPHALSVDDRNGMLYVFSRNIDPNGPVPHHNSSTCEGRSGYYSIYDINALKPLNNRRYEVTVDPYSSDVRFK